MSEKDAVAEVQCGGHESEHDDACMLVHVGPSRSGPFRRLRSQEFLLRLVARALPAVDAKSCGERALHATTKKEVPDTKSVRAWKCRKGRDEPPEGEGREGEEASETNKMSSR